MRKLINLFLYFSDWELLKKPFSTEIRESVVKDILSVDGEKWFHPQLPDGKTNPFFGSIEIIEGKTVFKEGTVDLCVYEHPNLQYRIIDFPLGTCKEGEFKNVTGKDCEIIRNVLYGAKDFERRRSFWQGPNLFLSTSYILFYRSIRSSLFVSVVILSFLAYLYFK